MDACFKEIAKNIPKVTAKGISKDQVEWIQSKRVKGNFEDISMEIPKKLPKIY